MSLDLSLPDWNSGPHAWPGHEGSIVLAHSLDGDPSQLLVVMTAKDPQGSVHSDSQFRWTLTDRQTIIIHRGLRAYHDWTIHIRIWVMAVKEVPGQAIRLMTRTQRPLQRGWGS